MMSDNNEYAKIMNYIYTTTDYKGDYDLKAASEMALCHGDFESSWMIQNKSHYFVEQADQED